MPEISEKAFEDAIEAGLLQGGPDALTGLPGTVRLSVGTYEDMAPGGYRRRTHEEYGRTLCLIPQDVLDFVRATQPREWERLERQHGPEVKERFLKRVSSEIKKRGVLDVQRKGIKDSGCKFSMAFIRPSSGLNEELERRYQGNLFCVARQDRQDHRLRMAKQKM